MQINSTHIGYLSLHQGPQAGWVNYPFTEADLTSTDNDKRNDVKSWLDGLNEPWSETSQHYNVRLWRCARRRAMDMRLHIDCV